MHTKSLTDRQRQIEQNLGKPDIVDEHPLMRCTPTVLGGHAHIKRNEITVERVLLALLRERPSGPLRVGPRTVTVTEEEVQATITYAVAIFNDISRLYAELDNRIQHAKGGVK